MLKVKPRVNTLRKLALISALSSALVACGGGGGSDAVDPRTPTGGGGVVDGSGSAPVVVTVIGNGTGDAFVEGVANASDTSLQAGGSTQISINLVDSNNSNTALTDDHTVLFTSDCVSNGLASFDGSSVISSSGLASANYTAEGCSGTDTITATATIDGSTYTAAVTLTIEADQVLGLELVSVAPPQLALAGLGGDETAIVTFRLVGEQSAPIVGEEVNFSVSSEAGGIQLVDGLITDVSDNDGIVSTVLQSGTVATSVEVIAEHSATGITASSGDITVSTGVPVQSKLSLSVDVFNPDSWGIDGVEVKFSIIASDIFGNDAPDGTQISFASPEAGNIDSSCTLVSGQCSVTWISSSPRPANGVVTILAHTTGAEDFDDFNGNAVYDTADTFSIAEHDLPEAYADENENGQYDAGEFFVNSVDEPGDPNTYDTGDGIWNGPCLSGTDASAICPANDADAITIFKMGTIVMSSHVVDTPEVGTFNVPSSTVLLPLATTTNLTGLIISDHNGNSLPSGSAVAFSITAVTGAVPTLIGGTEFDVQNTIQPLGPISLGVNPAEAGSSTLTATITIPGRGDQTLIWNLTY